MLAENIVHFSRLLRTAGLAIGPDRVLQALAAVQAVGVNRREDVHAALSAVMLDRHEQQSIFDAAFEAFWRDPKLLEQLMLLLLPKVSGRGDKTRPPRNNRLAEALAAPAKAPPPNPANQTAREEVQFETAFTFSERERLQQADFETMTAAEYAWARKLAEQLPLPVHPIRRRRHAAALHGTPDLRRTLQRMARQPGTLLPAFTRPRTEMPPLVVLLDISGSMGRYARLFLHYVQGLTRRDVRMQTFTAGFDKGSADVTLAAEGSQTRLSHVAQAQVGGKLAQVGGKLAQVGSRLIDAAAGKIAEDFFAAFEATLKAAVPQVAEVAEAPAPAAGYPKWMVWAAAAVVVAAAAAYWLGRVG
jgi:uncharacterized protein